MLLRNPFYPGKVCKEFCIYVLSVLLFYTFIAWDLLQINVYRFKAFCEWFLTIYPTYFISPLRISVLWWRASLVNTNIHIAGGKLDSVNYMTARGARLMNQIVSEHHRCADYCDQTRKCAIKQIAVKTLDYYTCIVLVSCIYVHVVSLRSFQFCMMY